MHSIEQKKIQFDNYINNYKDEIQKAINFIGQDVDFFLKLKTDLLAELTENFCVIDSEMNVLDIGCGIGLIDRLLTSRFKSITGVDVEDGVIEKARAFNPGVDYRLYDGRNLPFDDNTFDLAFAVNVMHHVPTAEWQNFVNELHRVVKPGGLAAIFEHNPANPATRRVVRNCIFDRDAVLLPHKRIIELFDKVGLNIVDDAYIIFFPFKGGLFRRAEKFLKWLPLGAQQYVAGRKL